MYSVRILPRAVKDISALPKDCARLVSQHIDALEEGPRPLDAKKLRGTGFIIYGWVRTASSTT